MAIAQRAITNGVVSLLSLMRVWCRMIHLSGSNISGKGFANGADDYNSQSDLSSIVTNLKATRPAADDYHDGENAGCKLVRLRTGRMSRCIEIEYGDRP